LRRTSSAAQLEIDFSAQLQSEAASEKPSKTLLSSAPTSFTAQGAAFAATSRMAGLRNASVVSDREIRDWLGERQKLLDKWEAGTITKADEVRLAYVNWNLDRVEAAKHGHVLSALEQAVAEYEGLATEIRALQEWLEKSKRKR